MVVADTTHALTLKEASLPPVQYIPREDAALGAVRATLVRPTHDGYDFALSLPHDHAGRYRAALDLPLVTGGFVYAWWFGRVYVDPKDPQHVFVAGVRLAESADGGRTWVQSQTPHADQHGLEWDPFTPAKVFLGNDGGFYWSEVNGTARGLWRKTPHLPVTPRRCCRRAAGA